MRVAILADCHLSSPDAPDGEENHAQGLGLLERAVAMIGELGCDRTIVVGDLVNMGYEAEYADARRALGPLLTGGAFNVIPGNHELVRGDLGRFVGEFGRACGRADFGGVEVLLLNTAQHSMDSRLWFGELDAESCGLLAAADPRGPLIVFMHHPFAGTVRAAPYPMMAQINGDRERDALAARPGPTIVFSGHAHRADVRRVGNCTFVGCPPLCFWPHAFLTADFADGLLRIETHRVVADVADSPDDKTQQGERHLTAAEYVADCEPPVPAFTLRLG